MLSIRILRYLAPRIARVSIEGTINGEISQITLTSFLFYTISYISSNRLSRNKESIGYICLVLRKVR